MLPTTGILNNSLTSQNAHVTVNINSTDGLLRHETEESLAAAGSEGQGNNSSKP